jgi:hypothetical protein
VFAFLPHPSARLRRQVAARQTLLLAKARRRAEQLMSRGPAELFDALEQAKRSEREVDFRSKGRRPLARHDGTVEAACALRCGSGASPRSRWRAEHVPVGCEPRGVRAWPRDGGRRARRCVAGPSSTQRR